MNPAPQESEDVRVMRMALVALETCEEGDYSTGHVIHPSFHEERVCEAITALRTRIAALSHSPNTEGGQSNG